MVDKEVRRRFINTWSTQLRGVGRVAGVRNHRFKRQAIDSAPALFVGARAYLSADARTHSRPSPTRLNCAWSIAN